MLTKRQLRHQMRQRLADLDDPARHRADRKLRVEIEALLHGPTVMLFAPFGREVGLDPLLAEVLATYGSVVLPRIHDDALWAHRCTDLDADLVPGVWGIREPRADRPVVDPTEIDVVVVPGLAFDRAGRRLGHGKAYYDRFLVRLRRDARTIGVGYDLQLVDEVPVEPHDQNVGVVVTDRHTAWSG